MTNHVLNQSKVRLLIALLTFSVVTASLAEDEPGYCYYPTPEMLAWKVAQAFSAGDLASLDKELPNAVGSITVNLEYAIAEQSSSPFWVDSFTALQPYLLKKRYSADRWQVPPLLHCDPGSCYFRANGIDHFRLYLTQLDYVAVELKYGPYLPVEGQASANPKDTQSCYQVTGLELLDGT